MSDRTEELRSVVNLMEYGQTLLERYHRESRRLHEYPVLAQLAERNCKAFSELSTILTTMMSAARFTIDEDEAENAAELTAATIVFVIETAFLLGAEAGGSAGRTPDA